MPSLSGGGPSQPDAEIDEGCRNENICAKSRRALTVLALGADERAECEGRGETDGAVYKRKQVERFNELHDPGFQTQAAPLRSLPSDDASHEPDERFSELTAVALACLDVSSGRWRA